MAKSVPTLTIRGLDAGTRKRLRMAAAEHNVSMEEEMRAILRGALDAGGMPAPARPSDCIASTAGLRCPWQPPPSSSSSAAGSPPTRRST